MEEQTIDFSSNTLALNFESAVEAAESVALIINIKGYEDRVAIYCPGCKDHHIINVGKGKPRHMWDGDVVQPTFYPNLLSPKGVAPKCHMFINGGIIKFLKDCDHELAGETLALPHHQFDINKFLGGE